MLVANFNVPVEAGIITVEQRDAMVRLLGMLERGEVRYGARQEPLSLSIIPKDPTLVDMGVWHCGTVACIGGWVDHLTGKRQWPHLENLMDNGKAGLRRLLFPPQRIFDDDLEGCAERVAHALRTFLTTGEPDWSREPEKS